MPKKIKKILFPCYFEPQQRKDAMAKAVAEGTPLAYIIRQLVKEWLKRGSDDGK